MRANELRIGNWVKSKTHNVEYKVTLIEEDYDYSHTEPIPLTEEWLVKFGFKNRGLRTTEQRPFFLFTNNGKGFTYRDGYISFVGVTVEKPIMHVHTLQNLYFALTGEELTLKI
jgi:hypothetical protein